MATKKPAPKKTAPVAKKAAPKSPVPRFPAGKVTQKPPTPVMTLSGEGARNMQPKTKPGF